MKITKSWTPLLLSVALLSALSCATDKPTGSAPAEPVRAVIFAPHPDDEVIAFGGLIYGMCRRGERVKVVVATSGDAYVAACDFWKSGIPPFAPGGKVSAAGKNLFPAATAASSPLPPAAPAATSPLSPAAMAAHSSSSCSPDDLAEFALARRAESVRATALLGLPEEDLIFLGYPDGMLATMLGRPDSLVSGRSSAVLSETGRSFRGRNLEEDLEAVLREAPGADVYTTHPADHNHDHFAMAEFVARARDAVAAGWPDSLRSDLYFAVVHEPGVTNDLAWPAPPCTWLPDWTRREERYDPVAALEPPAALAGSGVSLPLDEELWNPERRALPLLREAADLFQTEYGGILRSGAAPPAGTAGCIDPEGLLLAFVRRNELFWPERSRAGSRADSAGVRTMSGFAGSAGARP